MIFYRQLHPGLLYKDIHLTNPIQYIFVQPAAITYVWKIYLLFRQFLFLFRLLLSVEKQFIFLCVRTGKNLSTGFTSVILQLLTPVLNKAKKLNKYRIF